MTFASGLSVRSVTSTALAVSVSVSVIGLATASSASAADDGCTATSTATGSGTVATGVNLYPEIGSLSLWWTDPSNPTWVRSSVRMNLGDVAPNSATAGFEAYSGCDGNTIVDNLNPGTDYSFSVWEQFSTGDWSATGTSVTVHGSTLTLAASATRVAPRAKVTLIGSVKSRAAAAPLPAGQTVSVYARPVGGSWDWAGDSTADAKGQWHLTVNPLIDTDYKVYYYGDDTHQGEVEGSLRVYVAPIVGISSNHKSLKHGRSLTISTTVVGGHSGTVYLQQHSGAGWKTVKSAKLGSTGLATFTVKQAKKGSYAYRVYRPAGAGLEAGYSAGVKVKVT